LVPLLELQAKQHLAMFSRFTILASFTMCSHVAMDFRVSLDDPSSKLYRETKRRIRWITPEQAQTLLRELPPHQVDIVLFALSTGLRQSNVLELDWSQVDLDRRVAWIHADQAKGRRPIHVSLNSTALAVLVRQVGKHPVRVFTYNGMPVAWANTLAWRQALKRAGIEDFRWHDLRHTWAFSTARRHTWSRRWVLGNPKGWCGGTRTWLRRILRSMPK
jgi:integrase